MASGLEKVSVHTYSKKGDIKECANHRTAALISHTSKVLLKIIQSRMEGYMETELPDVQAGFRKKHTTRDHISNLRHRESKGIQPRAMPMLYRLQ
jgi:hypothetical protein